MAAPIPAAKLISRHFHNVPGKLRIGELFFDVPLDYANPDAKRLRLFARSVEKIESSAATTMSSNVDQSHSQLPWLVYVPGGPGFGAQPPQNYGITGFLLEKGYQVCTLSACCSFLRVYGSEDWKSADTLVGRRPITLPGSSRTCSLDLTRRILDTLLRPPRHGPFFHHHSGHRQTPRWA